MHQASCPARAVQANATCAAAAAAAAAAAGGHMWAVQHKQPNPLKNCAGRRKHNKKHNIKSVEADLE